MTPLKQLTTLVIDRSKWRTGALSRLNKTGIGDTVLLNEDGFMCCLGFYCEQSGVPKQKMLGIGRPGTLRMEVPLLSFSEMVNGSYSTKLTEELMDINDDERTTPAEKEALLTSRFAKEGISVSFVGEYKK